MYHNRKDPEMANRLPSTFNNAIVRKKKESGPLYCILKTLSMGKFNSCINRANVQLKSFPGIQSKAIGSSCHSNFTRAIL